MLGPCVGIDSSVDVRCVADKVVDVTSHAMLCLQRARLSVSFAYNLQPPMWRYLAGQLTHCRHCVAPVSRPIFFSGDLRPSNRERGATHRCGDLLVLQLADLPPS